MTLDARIRPRCVVHDGSVDAAAFVIDVGRLGHAEASRRVLRTWEAGATLLELDATRWVLQLPGPRRVMADACPGAPLTSSARSGSVFLLSAPLERSEAELLEAPPGSLVLVEGSHALPRALRDSPRLEPAVWLDVDAWQVVVGSPFDVTTAQAAAPEVAQASVRDLFGEAVPQPAEAQRRRRNLRQCERLRGLAVRLVATSRARAAWARECAGTRGLAIAHYVRLTNRNGAS